MKIATNHSWIVLPMSIPEKCEITLELSQAEFAKMKVGLIPDSMDDKWFGYFEDGWIYLHRSWTGNRVFKAEIHSGHKKYTITEFWAERDKERWKTESREEVIQSFRSHISYLSTRTINNPVRNAILGLTLGDILGVPVEFESRSSLKEITINST